MTILAGVEELALIHNGLNRPVYEDAAAALTECLTLLKFGFGIVAHNNPNSLSMRVVIVPISIPKMKSLIRLSYVPKWYVAINPVVIQVH